MQKQETPNLPLYFKRLGTFLDTVKVSVAQQKDLDRARNALKEILITIYGQPEISCPLDIPLFPPI
jgi:hypothetical protein